MSVSANEVTRIEPSQQSLDEVGTSMSVPTQESQVSPPGQIQQLILNTLESQGTISTSDSSRMIQICTRFEKEIPGESPTKWKVEQLQTRRDSIQDNKQKSANDPTQA
ncbi:uncharacterized protein K444DRAFT_625901 [Hyaloscypha bicolor E]|uniref:Uncharacterized protein n=1 Tax=Hyaloscypha bicolor E TaxID=1095630 RepID=A0A2J6TN74_9HELO|nr:uncharacterized protein K444DRAFT_625901 [Hyaloscypha bicolor E]PMD64447.1 hypothetical protein K444DRAFT_625901 [Hyaloscypha bicolor E]